MCISFIMTQRDRDKSSSNKFDGFEAKKHIKKGADVP